MKAKELIDSVVEFILTRQIEELKHLQEEEIANMTGVKHQFLARKFRSIQRISLPAFIVREKIYRAVFVLEKDGDKSIPELSSELGFSKVDDFNSEFEKYFAIKPERYRDVRKEHRRN